MYLGMPTILSKPELFRKAADALPEFCRIRAMILLSQGRMPLIELWHVLATCHQSIGHPDSSFFGDNYEQIAGIAKLGSEEQKERLNAFLKNIRTVMSAISDAMRFEPKPIVGCGANAYAAVMANYKPPLDPMCIETASPPQPAPKRKADSPLPQPAQKKKADSPPPPASKKPVSPLLGELVALGIGTAAVCQAFIDKPNVGFADQGVQCLADLTLLSKIDAEAMLRLVDLNGIQIHKILKAVFPA
jgi:hypothetical protein